MDNRPIGVFDSSVGGISVLREMRKLLPSERFIYFGDSGNAPYGVRAEDEIRDLTVRSVNDRLIQRDVKALVIACNTATSAAAETLREMLSIPVIGMEPALKPAAMGSESGRILVMATPATLRQSKFQRLMRQYGERAEMVPCGGLMEFVERGDLSSPALMAYLSDKLCSGEGKVAAVVLGCTHYVFLRRAVSELLPGVKLYDGNEGTARQLQSLLAERDALCAADQRGGVELTTSGDEAVMLPIMRTLLTIDV